ncbi:MAG TPA: hypothetical protein VGP07_04085 [Polyangia bacterium]
MSLFLCLTALALARSARAQDVCFQRVGGVPGAYGQPPDWWTSGSTPLGSATNRFIDDPRWQGATEYSHIGDTANFRALVETTAAGRNLVLAWHVRADPSNANDRLYVGFWDETTTLGNVFRIEKTSTTATPVAGGTFASGAYNGRFFHISGSGTGWALNNATSAIVPPLPDWLKNDTRVDEICSGTTCDEWAVRMHIPIDPAADVASDNPTGVKLTTGGKFRFWYQIQNGMTLGTSAVYGWPDGVAVASEGNPPCTSITGICLPDPSDPTTPWNEIQDGGSCHGDIGLQPGHIFNNTSGSIEVSLSAVNHFHAQPTNFLTSAQSGDAIQGTFRIANWGSAVGVSPGFLPICTNQISGPAATPVPGSGNFDIACDWTVPNPCDFKPSGDPCGPSAGSRTTDQCLLVDVAASPHNGPYLFSPASAWQNMMFTGASRVEKTAFLDLRALPALPGGNPNRDLYVYIKASNLPETAPTAERAPIPARPPTGRTNDGPAREKAAPIELPKRGAIGRQTAQVIAEALSAGRLSFDEAQAVMPTYVAYVWHDSGKVLGTGGSATKLLDGQPSFGMFVWHDGDLNGWRHSFEGRNVTPLGPNFFKVSVPEGGTARVTARVTACQLPLCLDHYVTGRTLLLLFLLALLIVLLLGLAVRKLVHP